MTRTRHNRPEGTPEFPTCEGDILKDEDGRLRSERVKIVQAGWRRHAAFLFTLYVATNINRVAEPDLTEARRQQILTNGFSRDHNHKIRTYPNAGFGIIQKRGYPIGRITVQRDATHIHVVDLAVLPEWQNRGVQDLILGLLTREAESLGIPLHLPTPLPALVSTPEEFSGP